MRSFTFFLAAMFLLAAHTSASAQLLRRKASCSSVYKRCLDYSAGYGPQEVKRCSELRETCMKTGEWKSRAFDYKDLVKR
jgi:hypothetical protein